MKAGKIIYIVLVLLLVTIFCISGFHVAKYFIESKQQQNHYDNLASIVESIQSAEPEPTQAIPTDPADIAATEATEVTEAGTAQPTEPVLLPEYQILYEMNPDLAGWIKIEGTRINYPVMHTPDDENYYLYRNFDKVWSDRGCIFAQGGCDINKPSDNITIYGHHMNDGSMFQNLSLYQRKEYWEKNSTFTFDTLTERHTYQVFAVFKTTASIGQGFEYHNFIDAADAAEFNEFVSTCKALSFYDTGITPGYGDKLICLSTCEYTQVNGRFVVAAVRIS